MALLQDPEPGQKVRSKYGVRDQGVITSISPELVGVVIVDDLSKPEETTTGLIRPAVGSHTLGAPGAGDFNHIQLFNPAGSLVDLFAEGVIVGTDTDQLLHIRISDSALATLIASTSKTFRDRRVSGEPFAEVRSDTPAGLQGETSVVVNLLASDPIIIPLGFTLGPGQDVMVATGTANTTLRVTFYWEERAQVR